MGDVTVRGLQLDDEQEMRRWVAMSVAVTQERDPAFVPKPFEEAWEQAREEIPGEVLTHLVAVDGDAVVGGAGYWLPLRSNLDTSYIDLMVHPGHRGRGVGAALAAALEARIPADRTNLVGAVRTRPGSLDTNPQMTFARRRGWEATSVLVVRDLALPVDPALLDRLDTAAHARAAGYRVEVHVSGVPAELREGLGRLKGMLDVEAPTGDIEYEATPMTPEDYAVILEQDARAGRRRVEAVAVADDGTVAGYSELEVPSIEERHVYQVATLVAPEHRGHRLGMALKVAALRTLAELGGAWPRVRTGNEENNRHMVDINEALGFEPRELEVVVRKRR